MIRYRYFYDHFHGSQPKTQEEVEQYTQGFLIYLIGTTLFANRLNILVQFYDWGGAGIATLYGYMSFGSHKKGNKVKGNWRAWELSVYAYFSALAPVPRDEVEAIVLYSWWCDGRCHPRHCSDNVFAYHRWFFDTMATHEPWVAIPAGTRDEYVGSSDPSRMRILLKGPFWRTWYCGERFVCQTLGSLALVVLAPPCASMRTTDGLLVEAIIQFMAG
ncbi:hypothetical protein CsSME_00037506 [Camellia sinensis var. sinensis]